MEYYSAIKKNEILPFDTTWMDLKGIMLNEITQRKIPYNFTYMWNLTSKQMKKYNKIETEPQIQRTNKLLPEGKGRKGRKEKGEGDEEV